MRINSGDISKHIIKQPIKKFANSNFMERICKNYRNKNEKFITGLSVASIAVKDGYGCLVYVRQNEKNKSIPEDKRKFLTGLDLANGLLMIGVQILTYMVLTKNNAFDKIFDKIFAAKFSNENYKKIEQNVISKIPQAVPDDIKKVFDIKKQNSKLAFNHLMSLICTTMLAKRVTVPLIATSFADFYKSKTEKKN